MSGDQPFCTASGLGIFERGRSGDGDAEVTGVTGGLFHEQYIKRFCCKPGSTRGIRETRANVVTNLALVSHELFVNRGLRAFATSLTQGSGCITDRKQGR